jgi:hypothetical protein
MIEVTHASHHWQVMKVISWIPGAGGTSRTLARPPRRGRLSLHALEEIPYQSKSRIEHAPGPRGSPQLPQAPPSGVAPLDAPLADTANTESCGSSFLLWHFGHSALSFPYTSASNSCWHWLQMYSKIGMNFSLISGDSACDYLK